MKKYNLYLWLAALVGLFASCSQNETDMLQTNESNRVSLTAELPDDFAQIGTRALPDVPDGSCKLRCILEVWNNELSTLIVRQEAAPGNTDNITFNFELTTPGDYKALLWADYIPSGTQASSATIAGLSNVQHFADKYYTTNGSTGLQAVARKEGEATNPDRLDAFFACESFEKEATALNNLSATLLRPFTKLTIAEKNSTNFAFCKSVSAKATIPTQINVATGVVSVPQEIEMWNAAPSGAEITVGGSTNCKTLFSTYILATTDGTMPDIKLKFIATLESGKTLKTITIPSGVPAKRNYRVNAAGNLIQAEDEPSSTTKMTVDINAEWATPDVEKDATPNVWDGVSIAEPAGYTGSPATVYITSAAELAWLALQCNGGNDFRGYTFNLATDIDLNNKDWTPIGDFVGGNPFSGSFNGQGHTVRNMKVIRQSDNSDIRAGFFGRIQGPSTTVSNLIVEGEVKGTSSSESCHVGGICGYAVNANIKFCRFNGSVSGTGNNKAQNYSGGIVGEFWGDTGTMTCCISNATVTAEGGAGPAGGLIGSLIENTATYSAWNSSNTEEGIGHITSGTNTSNQSFTTIATLNGLLDDINASQPDSEYMWEANGADAFPKLVKRAN